MREPVSEVGPHRRLLPSGTSTAEESVGQLQSPGASQDAPGARPGQKPFTPFGVPTPVTPSQPLRAVHRGTPQAPLLPAVMSYRLLDRW